MIIDPLHAHNSLFHVRWMCGRFQCCLEIWMAYTKLFCTCIAWNFLGFNFFFQQVKKPLEISKKRNIKWVCLTEFEMSLQWQCKMCVKLHSCEIDFVSIETDLVAFLQKNCHFIDSFRTRVSNTLTNEMIVIKMFKGDKIQN